MGMFRPLPKLTNGRTLFEAVRVREDKVQQLKNDSRRIKILPRPSVLVRKRMCELGFGQSRAGAAGAARLMTGGDIAFAQARHNKCQPG